MGLIIFKLEHETNLNNLETDLYTFLVEFKVTLLRHGISCKVSYFMNSRDFSIKFITIILHDNIWLGTYRIII